MSWLYAIKHFFVGFFAVFVLGLVMLGFAIMITGCQREPQHWQMYRFDKDWRPYKISP
jgi:hypothetical protein